jgi:ADP-ribose pyrophosphatase
MGWIFTTPGFTDERIWLYLARDLKPAKQKLQTDEVLTIEKMPLRDAFELALNGKIHDAKTLCALLRAPRHLQD